MTREDLDFIKDALSQIIDDIGGNPYWHEAARAVASDLGTLERELEKNVAKLPSNLDEAAEESARSWRKNPDGSESRELFFQPYIRGFKAGAEWMAGQGNIVETEPYFCDEEGNAEITAGTTFKPHEKVRVQITKI